MATLIGDYASEPSRFHTMIATPGLHYNHNQHQQQQHPEPPHYRSTSRSREAPSRQQSSSSSSTSPSSRTQRPAQTPSSSSASTSRYTSTTPQAHSSRGSAVAAPADKLATSSSGGASRFPSPPDSSSPSGSAASASRSEENLARSQHGSRSAYMDSTAHDFAQEASSSVSTQSTVIAPSSTTSRGPQAIPSPASEPGAAWSSSHNDLASSSPPPQTQTTIRVRDLAHIQSLARADLLSGSGPGILNDPPLQAMKYEISGMPISDIIEMVAALLTKITTTNDLQHDALNRNANHVKQAQAQNEGSAGENHMSPMSSSVLAFHGKNVPAITILSYLSRIHKYCPTTYEVFLSLLVYFDRMTERVNDIVMKAEETRRSGQTAAVTEPPQVDVVMRDEGSHGEDETDEDLADDSDDEDMDRPSKTGHGDNGATASEAARSTSAPINQQATFFVVDSFNIHRLIIAGVTCASKFFSDVFYTNSRYAKVGGLPLAELNHLELQFLLLNDFRLAVPVEDLEAYATMLVEFYAREVVAQRSRPVVSMD